MWRMTPSVIFGAREISSSASPQEKVTRWQAASPSSVDLVGELVKPDEGDVSEVGVALDDLGARCARGRPRDRAGVERILRSSGRWRCLPARSFLASVDPG
jgi:hypothetical protein